jgi:hypothetical protein
VHRACHPNASDSRLLGASCYCQGEAVSRALAMTSSAAERAPPAGQAPQWLRSSRAPRNVCARSVVRSAMTPYCRSEGPPPPVADGPSVLTARDFARCSRVAGNRSCGRPRACRDLELPSPQAAGASSGAPSDAGAAASCGSNGLLLGRPARIRIPCANTTSPFAGGGRPRTGRSTRCRWYPPCNRLAHRRPFREASRPRPRGDPNEP